MVLSLKYTNVYLGYDYMIIIKDPYFNQLSLFIIDKRNELVKKAC